VAIRVAVGFVAERLQVPVAGWCDDPEGSMSLVAAQGLGSKKRRGIQEAMSSLPRWFSLSAEEKHAVRRRFAQITGVGEVSCLEVGGGILLAGCPTQSIEASLEVVGALLAEVVQLRSAATSAERRNERLDMGIAWTAHELRGPLLGVRAVLDLMLQREETGPRDHEILHRSLRELDHLAGTTEGLLAWAVGARPLDMRRADLVRVVEEAVESCRLEPGGDGIVMYAPKHAFARVEAATLRSAVANLLRNALSFADPGSKVEVEVEVGSEQIVVKVKDRGPMIPPIDQEAIFDPFMRGSGSIQGRSSSGLGLFIARRIVEAHHGSIWVESDEQGTTFLIVLPLDQGRVTRAAS
jgi:signal transduction histidine kinase